jgi:hypothetical protein
MRRWMTTTAMVGLLSALGCGGGEAESEAEEGMHETETALAEHEAAGEPIDELASVGPTAEQVPIPADFLDEARTSIDETNYGDVLDAIETELAE